MENKSALISLILGILTFIPLLGFILAPPAIIYGIYGIRIQAGRPMAISGIVLGILGIIFNIIFFIFVVIPFLLAFAIAAACFAVCQSCAQSGT